MITVQTTIKGDLKKVWDMWTRPEHITGWNFASDDWECPTAENDLRVGGKFKLTMSAKDKSAGFDFEGTYTKVEPQKLIACEFGGRNAVVMFESKGNMVKIVQSFDPENENPEEMQRSGWQSILDNFKKYVEAH